MTINDPIEQITMRISALQKEYVLLQEKFKSYQNNVNSDLNNSALRIIDILDLLEMIKMTDKHLDNGGNLNVELLFKKIEKRLIDVLKHWRVQEIVLTDNKIEPGKTKVIETRKALPGMVGTSIEICRKGYQRGDKVLRPAEIITTEGL